MLLSPTFLLLNVFPIGHELVALHLVWAHLNLFLDVCHQFFGHFDFLFG